MGKRFEHLVDPFTARVKAADIGPSTEVALVLHWADEQGQDLPASRESLVPKVSVTRPGHEEAARRLAANLLLATILENLKRCILDAPDGSIPSRKWPTPIVIRDITLEITQP